MNINALKQSNAARWKNVHLNANRIGALDATAKRLCAPAAKERYMEISKATGVPWFVIAVIHEREASQNFNRQLSQGDPLDRVSVHVPSGRGPFLNHPTDPPLHDAFYRGALDALIDCPPHAAKWTDWSAGGALTLLEEYNGLGYASRGRPSPYVWSGTDQYKSGKYVADGVYDPNAIDQQLGCAAIIARMAAIDSSVKFIGDVVPPVNPPLHPLPKVTPVDPWWVSMLKVIFGVK